MTEYTTDALILDIEDIGELDQLVYLYTPDLGKVVAKAKSSRKITSKLSGHLQPFGISKVRLVEKNGVQVVDAISVRQFEKSTETARLLRFIKEMTYEFHPDKKLWLVIKKYLKELELGGKKEEAKSFSYKTLLEILGFAPDYARCNICKDKKVKYFYPEEQIFLCEKCVAKIPQNKVVLI